MANAEARIRIYLQRKFSENRSYNPLTNVEPILMSTGDNGKELAGFKLRPIIDEESRAAEGRRRPVREEPFNWRPVPINTSGIPDSTTGVEQYWDHVAARTPTVPTDPTVVPTDVKTVNLSNLRTQLTKWNTINSWTEPDWFNTLISTYHTTCTDMNNKKNKLSFIAATDNFRAGSSNERAISRDFFINEIMFCAINGFLNAIGRPLCIMFYNYLCTNNIQYLLKNPVEGATGITSGSNPGVQGPALSAEQSDEMLNAITTAWGAVDGERGAAYNSISLRPLKKQAIAKTVVGAIVGKLVHVLWQDKPIRDAFMDHLKKTPSCSSVIYILSTYLLNPYLTGFNEMHMISDLAIDLDETLRRYYGLEKWQQSTRGYLQFTPPTTPFTGLPPLPKVGGYRRTRRNRKNRRKSRKNRRHH